jgi:hemerythrin
MEKTGFPGLEEHRGEHLKFIANVAEMTKRFMGSSNPRHALEIAEFLYNWIVDHVYQMDGRYVDYLHDHAMEWCSPSEITGTVRQEARAENSKDQVPGS